IRIGERSAGFYFDDYSFFDEQIRAKATDFGPPIPHFERRLFYDCQAERPKFNGERSSIHAFEKTVAELVVRNVKAVDHGSGNLAGQQRCLILRCLRHGKTLPPGDSVVPSK